VRTTRWIVPKAFLGCEAFFQRSEILETYRRSNHFLSFLFSIGAFLPSQNISFYVPFRWGGAKTMFLSLFSLCLVPPIVFFLNRHAMPSIWYVATGSHGYFPLYLSEEWFIFLIKYFFVENKVCGDRIVNLVSYYYNEKYIIWLDFCYCDWWCDSALIQTTQLLNVWLSKISEHR